MSNWFDVFLAGTVARNSCQAKSLACDWPWLAVKQPFSPSALCFRAMPLPSLVSCSREPTCCSVCVCVCASYCQKLVERREKSRSGDTESLL